MKASAYWFQTQRSVSQDVVSPGHQLMLKAGLVRPMGSGLMAWLPTGARVLNKISALIRREMNELGALEILMPIMHPSHFWEISKRIEKYGPELFILKDRHEKTLILGPTHEECICMLVQNRFDSVDDFPKILYQIQTKFRDEKRPRGGIVRAREFLMKDAYSFHLSKASLHETYAQMHAAYTRLFQKLDLDIAVIEADNGQIGGACSHEFHALSPSGEDRLALTSKGLAFNASAVPAGLSFEEAASAAPEERFIRHIFTTQNKSHPYVVLITLQNHRPNHLKVQKVLPWINLDVLKKLSEEEIREHFGQCDSALELLSQQWTIPEAPFCIDQSAAAAFQGPLEGLDPLIEDFREVACGDWIESPHHRIEKIVSTLEIGHIFQLGAVYSQPFNLSHPAQIDAPLLMGCYGIGVSRLVAALLEQHADERGARFPVQVAPFTVGIAVLNAQQYPAMHAFAQSLYQAFGQQQFEILFDDRPVRPGVMLTDMERIGIPYLIVFGQRSFEQGRAECRVRLPKNNSETCVSLEGLQDWIRQRLHETV